MAITTPGETADETSAAGHSRRARARAAAAAHGVPLATIIASIAVVSLTFLAGELIYRLRDIVLLMVVAGFVALLLNPLVLYLQQWRIRRRGPVVTVWAALVFVGLVTAFGYPLVNGLTHFSHQLPSYVSSVEHGSGWIGQLLRRFHLQAWVSRNAPKLETLGAAWPSPR
jgi:predicted PurR-regulated permease PerM